MFSFFYNITMSYLSDFDKTIRNDRQMKSLIGLSRKEFDFLVPLFQETFDQVQKEMYQERLKKNPNARRPGSGRKGRLDTPEKKLFFFLNYAKTYPTFDVLGFHFDLARTKACENVHKIAPICSRMFQDLGVKPKREITSPEEFIEVFGTIEELIVDATERRYFRNKDHKEQKKNYSGKKKPIKRRIR